MVYVKVLAIEQQKQAEHAVQDACVSGQMGTVIRAAAMWVECFADRCMWCLPERPLL